MEFIVFFCCCFRFVFLNLESEYIIMLSRKILIFKKDVFFMERHRLICGESLPIKNSVFHQNIHFSRYIFDRCHVFKMQNVAIASS